STLIELNRRMRDRGVTTYLEVVSTSPEACLQSARAAVEIGVDRLMGGQQITETLQLLRGTSIEYLPFPGVPVGHPTRLGGDPALVEQQSREFAAMGCSGVDLLAFRATEADPPALVRAARRHRASLLGLSLAVCMAVWWCPPGGRRPARSPT